MRINDQNLTGISSSQLGRTPETETGNRHGRSGGASHGGGDQVHLSSLADQIQTLSAGSAERAAYLEKLSAEVQTGRYSVDAELLSRTLVDDALKNRT